MDDPKKKSPFISDEKYMIEINIIIKRKALSLEKRDIPINPTK